MRETPLYAILLLLSLVSGGAAAVAEEHYYSPGQPAAEEQETAPEAQQGLRTLTITSIQKCYAQLSREDALEIQKNYTKPYQECQRRLSLKLKQKKTIKAGEEPAKGETSEEPRHFLRVSPQPKKFSAGPQKQPVPAAKPLN